MTSKYSYNEKGFTVNSGEIIPLNNVANQCGNSTSCVTNGIQINNPGQYRITATISGLVSTGGIINMQVLQNGVAIPTLIGQAYTDLNEPATITVSDVIKVKPNCCMIQNNPVVITMINNGTSNDTLVLSSLNVEKIN